MVSSLLLKGQYTPTYISLLHGSPFKRFGVVPVGGRSTVVRLANSDLWVLASTPLDDPTKAQISELGGRVRYIIGPDAVHSLYLCM